MVSTVDVAVCTCDTYLDERVGASFAQIKRCTRSKSNSAVMRAINEAVKAGLINIKMRGKRKIYVPTVKGTVYAAVDKEFGGCTRFVKAVIDEAIIWLHPDAFNCSSLVITSRYSEDEACRCLKLGILKLISNTLSGFEDRRLADSILIDEIYRVIGRLRKLLTSELALALATNGAKPAKPIHEAMREFRESEPECSNRFRKLKSWLSY